MDTKKKISKRVIDLCGSSKHDFDPKHYINVLRSIALQALICKYLFILTGLYICTSVIATATNVSLMNKSK